MSALDGLAQQPKKLSPSTTDEERRLIDEALAAGRVTRIPVGVTAAHPSAARYLASDPERHSIMRPALAWMLKNVERGPLAAEDIQYGMNHSRVSPPSGMLRADLKLALEALVTKGFVDRFEPKAKGRDKGPRYKIADGAPEIDLSDVRAEQERRRAAFRSRKMVG